ncbi:E3 ubiquitin/ISG15 ligase TRIM25 [Austrofundulus limnaeus]|uniref:E3 ubiquitin/ISG15 ligase TRIM25 n=1 Tax=Austrofundulus limnaeus TaxID=52670 RepID=A0A2I4BSX2_AUSLI|nr:PREDICTED: E3 ubiquitin/ISG15 ligase TRIM25-like [Austrofundulus limnaeus]
MFMSKPEEQLAQELSCPICLQLFCDPVVLPCGHNYCRACIVKTAQSTENTGKTPPRCPECREEYEGLAILQKNFKLSNIVDGYRASTTQIYEEIVIEPETGSKKTTVFCDHCIDAPLPAVKTCLKCEVRLCSRHLQKHNEKESFKGHSLMEPQTELLGTRSCSKHHLPLEYFCSNDVTTLCSTCFVEGHHQDHDVLTFSAAEDEMRRALESRSKIISSRLQMTESLLNRTMEDQGASEATGDRMVSKAVTLMDSMAGMVERYRERLCTLLEEERGQRRKSFQMGVSALEEQQQQLLEAQKSAAQTLTETDTCVFIHRFIMIDQKLRDNVTGSISTTIPSKAPLNTKRLQAELKTQDFRTEMVRLLDSLHVLLDPMELTFNICTVHPSLVVSTDLRTVRYSPTKQSYVDHPDRFTSASQILCSQSFSGGTHVWVVEVGANCMWSLGVCYKSIPRRGDHSRLGHNTMSWRLQRKNGKLTVCTASSNIALSEMVIPPTKIEIVLDYEGGALTFNSIKGRRELLYTFRAVFKEPVYPAFSIHSNTPESWITLQSGM